MVKPELKVSAVYYRNYLSKKKIKCNQGGARSSKTYSILQLLITFALRETEKKIYTIVRKTFNTLKTTAMRDFFEILESINLYDVSLHNKTDHEYKLGNVLFEFQGLDQPTKKRGAKRNKLFINEANELTQEDWLQLLIRTTEDIYIDYNPADEFHWIYDIVIPREDCEFIKSTYKDNPFLAVSIREEIQRLTGNAKRIYAEGERGISEQIIYKNWEIVHSIPENFKTVYYGLDFGFVKPSALMKIYEYDDFVLLEEKIYETRLTNQQLIERLDETIENKSDNIYADCAEPARIAEISNAGFNIYESDKSVKDGIDYCRRLKVKILYTSTNAIKEIKSYSNKVDKNGIILEEPIKFNDHLMDAWRYGSYTYSLLGNYTEPNIRRF